MRIGFITYEYPPDIAGGGIATYTEQVANLLVNRGHEVEVFCGSHYRSLTEKVNGVLIHRCYSKNAQTFNDDCLKKFEERLEFKSFDVIECPEINGNGMKIKKKFPTIPLVVKLHTPVFLQMRLLNYYTPWHVRLRYFLGALRRGRLRRYGSYDFKNDMDFLQTKMAECIVSPSFSLKEIISKEWHIEKNKIEVIGNPFVPPDILLNIKINSEIKHEKTVLFVGKLNVHKGIVSLVKAIPEVVREHRDVKFILVGSDSYFNRKRMMMSDYIRQELRCLKNNFIITGELRYDDTLRYYKEAFLCVFPSIWENFPTVCLEAMAAGRAIVGSKNGGMNELLNHQAGILVDPLDEQALAKEINNLLYNPLQREQLGRKAREAILTNFNSSRLIEKIERNYEKAIMLGGKVDL